MKVFNLCCVNDHRFEGWFGSADAFDQQSSTGMLQCPMCGSTEVRRLPSAPRLNLSGAAAVPATTKESAQGPTTPGDPARAGAHDPEQLQRAWFALARYIQANTEDVGERFADEARRIHYGESPARGIRGQASPAQAAALTEEGIEVVAFPMPDAAKGPLQ